MDEENTETAGQAPGPSKVRVVSDGQPPRADPDAQTPGATSAREKGNDDAKYRSSRAI